jgi:hypothetical protein
MKALPKYRCHKVVSAAKIADFENDDIAIVTFPDGTIEHVALPGDFWHRYKGGAKDRGYLVIYDNDYISWSPTDAFENGYSLIDESEKAG